MAQKKPLILAVDDERDVLQLIKRILERAGYKVITASDGSQALDLVAEKNPELVLLDIKMPVKSGMEVLAELKAHQGDIGVIMVSGIDDVKTSIQAMREGAFDYLVKPFNTDELVLSVERALEKARLIQENRDYQLNLEFMVDRLQAVILANVSHELRTPLASIKGFVTTLLATDVKWSKEEQWDFLQSIDRETDRLTRMVNELLDMSRLQFGTLRLEKDNYQISEILDEVSDRLASLTEHHQLRVMVPEELPPVFVDKMRIQQVLTNLVQNALDFFEKGSPITIEAQLAGSQIIVSVTGRGEDIFSKFLDRAFDQFYQTKSIIAGQKSAIGLGLPMCRGIIEAHGGKIWAEGEAGKSCRFSLSLPLSKTEGTVA